MRFVPAVLLLAMALPAPAGAKNKRALPLAAVEEKTNPSELAAMIGVFEQANKGVVGASAVDLATGKVLLAHRDEELFTPASNMKLVSSAFAMARLGGNFRFKTTVYSMGDDLLVVGDFDPTLGDPVLAAQQKKTIYAELDQWAAAVKSRLGDTLRGDILVLSAPPAGDSYRHPAWPADQRDRWYCAPIARLSFNNNCIDVTFKMEQGQPVPVLSPESRFIRVVNAVKAGKGNLFSLRASNDDSVVTLSGTAAKAAADPVSVAVNNPPLLCGRTFADRLVRAGMSFNGKIVEADPDAFDLSKASGIVQTATPLWLAMSRANKKSLNMAAECIFLRAGDGTWEGSAKIEKSVLAQAYGIGADEIEISDGSGFSRKNAIAPQAMTKLLAGVLKRGDSRIFVESLPISGTDGTLSKRMGAAKYRGRVLGKTGYIAGVSCLSGYVLDASGKPAIAYSVLVNKCRDLAQAKALEEDICEKLVDAVDRR